MTDSDGLVTESEYNTNNWTTKVTNKVDAVRTDDIIVKATKLINARELRRKVC